MKSPDVKSLHNHDEIHLELADVGLRFPRSRGKEFLMKSRNPSGLGDQSFALRGVTLDLRPGDRLGVVGMNGAGKTSLLRVMAGIYPATEGQVHRVGTVATVLDAGFGLEPTQSGFANAYTYGILHQQTPEAIVRLQEQVKRESGLGERIHDPVRTYSTGMQTRLVFALTTSFTPDILIMDEALATGDVEFQERAKVKTRELMSGVSILVCASHSRDFLLDTCEKGIVLSEGRIVFSGGIKSALDLHFSE